MSQIQFCGNISMAKRKFYVYQEDLIRYKLVQETVTISQLVEELNKKYSQDDMQKLRTETITNYLTNNGYLVVNDNGKKRPTFKGKILGIEVGYITDKVGQEIEVNMYNDRAQKFILDNLYEMI